ncbi:poly(rC)-binding protein 4-like isoform X2 [Rhopilema esculentum]
MAEAKVDSKLTVRFLILSQDAGGIIGKEGANIKRIIEKSNAQVNITGTAGIERVLNVTGSVDEISTAVCLIAERLEEITGPSSYGQQSDHVPPVTIRLLAPNSQCGPLIGKGGSRIKEIREASGATITIPSENLPGCSERAVTLSGSPEALGICMEKICDIFVEFPPRNNNIKFVPSMGGFGGASPQVLSLMTNQLSFTGLSRRTQQKITLPSSVIGSVIGKGGCHINEVRRFSGANIHIEEAKGRRSTVTLSGAPEAVSCANFLINARIQAGRTAQNRSRMNSRPRN